MPSFHKRKSPFFTRLSTVVQKVGKYQPHVLNHAFLKLAFLAPTTYARILVNLATQPLKQHEPHIRETSDQAVLPGYWIAPLVASVQDLPKWETNHEDFDLLLVYCHGGAFSVGHALMYSNFMNHVVMNSKVRVRIYSIEYKLPLSTKYSTRFPYQHQKLLTAYKKLLEHGIPPGKIVIGGDSAGAFNALKCFEKLVEEQIPRPGGILLNSPWVDLYVPRSRKENSMLSPGNSLAKNAGKDYNSPRFLKNGLKLYKPPVNSSPSNTGTWYAANLPKTFLSYGSGEVLMDSIRGFETELRTGKLDLTTFVGQDEAHTFNVLNPEYSRSQQSWEEANTSLVTWLARVAGAV